MKQSRNGERFRIATLVREDFYILITILDRQLAEESKHYPEARAAITEARAAARRGLELTRKLVALLEIAHQRGESGVAKTCSPSRTFPCPDFSSPSRLD